MPHLVVIYGPPRSGKSSLAREVARSLDGKAAVVSTDALLHDAIRVHDANVLDELEMVHTQARLLVANYLKNRYHVVLEGAFAYVSDGTLQQRENEIDQILGLMRNLARTPLVVRLTASPETIQARFDGVSGVDDAAKVAAAYRERYGGQSIVLSSDALSPEELAAEVVSRLSESERY